MIVYLTRNLPAVGADAHIGPQIKVTGSHWLSAKSKHCAAGAMWASPPTLVENNQLNDNCGYHLN